MKKISVILLLVLICMQFSVCAEQAITVTIPDYEIVLNETPVYYYDSLYPFLNYKGITYFPATFEYCKGMDLACGFDGNAFLIAYNPSYENIPLYETAKNTKKNTAVIPSYNVIVNGKEIDNTKQQYPVFNFRGVTYFPMTWDYAVNEFGWTIDFSGKTFTITTNTSMRDDIGEKVEVDDKGIIFREYGYMEMPQPDGTVQTIPGLIYYQASFETGEIVRRDDYTQADEPKNTAKNEEVKLEVKDGYVYYKNQKLDGVFVEEASPDFVKPEDVEKVEYNVSMYKTENFKPLTVCKMNVYTAYSKKDGSRYGGDADYTYLLHNDEMIFLDGNTMVSNPYVMGDTMYFNTNKYWKTFSTHTLQNKQLMKLTPDGAVVQIKDENFNNMEIIGVADNKLYLKCTWSPEDYIEGGEVKTSLVNDGYFTFDGEKLEKVAHYVYSTYDAVSPKGEILAINRRLGKVIKVK